MRQVSGFVVLLFMLACLAGQAWGQGGCQGKQRRDYSPGSSAYRQITEEEAKASKNHIRADQFTVSIKGESPSGDFKVQESVE